MIGIAVQTMVPKVDDEVQEFQRNLADPDGAIVGDFGNVAEDDISRRNPPFHKKGG